jgi:hypothetical protein
MTILLRRAKGRLARLVLLILLVVIAGISAGTSAAAADFGPKVDPSLAAVASRASSATPLHAIVYGSNLEATNAALGSTLNVRQPLGEIGGESVTITAGAVSQLTAQDGVDYVILDATSH